MEVGIYALSSGYSKSAIAVVRIVKKDVLNDILQFINKKKIKPRYATLVNIYKDKEKTKILDNCILIYFEGKSSYCGIDTVELYLHGSLFIVKELFNLLDSIGYREAEPGEFTKLAVLNGKMDLIQAEAINNLINADSQLAYENSLKNLGREFSEKLNIFEKKIIEISSFLEASLEYPEEEFEDESEYIKKIKSDFEFLIAEISEILKNSVNSLALHNKINIVIVGPTNSGKSSLFNFLLKEDRSIVSDIHGTTRDYIESELTLGNLHISLFDTAGIRYSEDKIERIGINRVKKLIKDSDYIIFLVSIDCDIDDDLFQIYKENKDKLLVVLNKIDLLIKDKDKNNKFGKKEILKIIEQSNEMKEKVKNLIFLEENNFMPISVEYGYGIIYLEDYIRKKFELVENINKIDDNNQYLFIQTVRQKKLLEQVLNYIVEAKDILFEKNLYDIAAENLKNAYNTINELTGKLYSEDLFNEVFSKFCLGK